MLSLSVLGCGDAEQADDVRDAGGAVAAELTPIGDPGVDASPFPIDRGTVTAAGTDLVVISSSWPPGQEIEAALRREDGSWWKLPPLPFTGFIHLATAGDRAVAGGVACGDGSCQEGELAFAMLSEDHSEWVRLDAPEVALSVTETELTTSPGPAEFAEFAIGSSTYSVDSQGEFDGWTPRPIPGPAAGSSEFGCAAGSTYASMPLQVLDVNEGVKVGHMQEMAGDVHVQPIGGSTDPVAVAPVPPGTVSAYGYFCAGNDMVIHHAGSETTFHIDTRTWQVAPSNFDSLGDGQVFPVSGRLAVAPDGSSAFLTGGGGPVYRRNSPGQWDDTGAVGFVFATDSQVLVIGEDRTVTTVWPV